MDTVGGRIKLTSEDKILKHLGYMLLSSDKQTQYSIDTENLPFSASEKYYPIEIIRNQQRLPRDVYNNGRRNSYHNKKID